MAAIPESNLPGHQHLHGRVCSALELCQESREIEFKRAEPWGSLKTHIARTAMAMSNQRDGGIIVIGVTEEDGKWALPGVPDDVLDTYDEDEVNDFINRYASPTITIRLVRVSFNGAGFLACSVPEFERTPTVCKRNGPEGSRIDETAIYIRTSGKPQTTRIRTAGDLVDLLELAVEKRARELLTSTRRIGLVPKESPEDIFDGELGGL